ncbi:hypothetical protein HBH70_033570 [Parastagonospora nodorum]|nr:hypothetical protein HBH70_033570 [Parastagonospora nodorum]
MQASDGVGEVIPLEELEADVKDGVDVTAALVVDETTELDSVHVEEAVEESEVVEATALEGSGVCETVGLADSLVLETASEVDETTDVDVTEVDNPVELEDIDVDIAVKIEDTDIDRGSEELIVCVNDTEVLGLEDSCIEVGDGVVVELTENEVSVELKDVAVKL